MTQPRFLVLVVALLSTLAACAVSTEHTGAAAQGLGGSGGSGGSEELACFSGEPLCPRKSQSDCGPTPDQGGVFLATCCASNGTESASMDQCAVDISGTLYWLTTKCPTCDPGSGICVVAGDGTTICSYFGLPVGP